jgi:hypothetical protein
MQRPHLSRGKFSEQSGFGRFAHVDGIFEASKQTKISICAANLDVDLPLRCAPMPSYSGRSANIVDADRLVAHILSVCGFPEIIPSIVRAISISVVDLGLWPLSGHVQNSKPVRFVVLPANADFQISMAIARASGFTGLDAFSVRSPRKNPAKAIVVQQLSQTFGRQHTSERVNHSVPERIAVAL